MTRIDLFYRPHHVHVKMLVDGAPSTASLTIENRGGHQRVELDGKELDDVEVWYHRDDESWLSISIMPADIDLFIFDRGSRPWPSRTVE